jgi:hypothetical protein
MSKKEKSLYIGVILVILFLYISPLINFSNKVNDNCQYMIDSLNSEILTLQIDKGRYEIILERVNEIDSNVYANAIKNIE